MTRALALVGGETRRRTIIERFETYTAVRKSDRTAEIYGWAARQLDAWLTARRDTREFEALDSDDLDQFLHAFTKGKDGFRPHATSYVNQVYRSLQQFYAWHSASCKSVRPYDSPMADVAQRKVGEVRYEGKVLTAQQVDAIIATVDNRRDFVSIRDLALLQLFRSGLRRDEVLSLDEDRMHLSGRSDSYVTVKGKPTDSGPRWRDVPIGGRTVLALLDYLEARAAHRYAHLPQLWISERGTLGGRGVHRIVEKRGRQAGIEGVYPHKFRHSAASRWVESGASESEAMEHFGWESREMLDRYARATRAERARQTARKIALDG